MNRGGINHKRRPAVMLLFLILVLTSAASRVCAAKDNKELQSMVVDAYLEMRTAR